MVKVWSVLVILTVAVLCVLPQRTIAQNKTDLIMTIINSGYHIEVKAGQDNHFALEVRNIGTTTLNNILLSSDVVDGWTIDFVPTEIKYLSPGSVQIVDINMKPSSNPPGGIQYIRFFATAGVFQTVQSFEVEVKMVPLWFWAVIGIAVAVIAAFVFIFLRMGRRR
jgi:uncharacterized membrane protein